MAIRKSILVTGATGFIGANLVRKLINQTHEVHILKRKEPDIWRIKDILPKVHVHDIDLLEKKKLFSKIQIIKPKVIFHLANLGMYGGIDPTIEKSININLIGTVNLIEATHNIDYEGFINTGSSSEYGIKYSPMKENDLCQPTSNYAISKLASTLYAQSYAKRTKKPLATLRLFSPFGPFDHPARLIPLTILKLLKKEIFVLNNPLDVRDYIYMDDVIDAYLLCIRKSHKLNGEIFNIGSGKQIYVKDVIKLLAAKMGSDLTIQNNISSKENELIVWQADIKKAKRILGWQPKKKLDQGLEETISWFKKNSYLYD